VIAVKMAIRDCYKSTHMGEMLKEKGKKKEEKVKTNNWGGYLRKRIISTCSDDLQGNAV
jgi:hypothetical protein